MSGCNHQEEKLIEMISRNINLCQTWHQTLAMVSAGAGHTVLLRSDGQVVACGKNQNGQCSIPPLEEGISYTQVSAGEDQTMLLRSDGQVVACGYLRYDLPPVEDGLPYVQVSAGWNQWPLLLRSDGKVIMYPSDKTEDGVTYVQAGGPCGVGQDHHTTTYHW